MADQTPEIARPEIPTVRQGYGRDWPLVKGKCPTCGTAALFLGSGGFVLCANVRCADPVAPSIALSVEFADRGSSPAGEGR